VERGHPVRLSAQRERIPTASVSPDLSGLRPLADKDVRAPKSFLNTFKITLDSP
jgi:hypothetical protein